MSYLEVQLLNVEAFSNVDNSWATFDVSLVNEKNNEVITATKDIEYYHGYEGGKLGGR